MSDIEWCTGRLTTGPASGKLKDVREVLRCGLLPELQAAITAPLDWSRFWRNVRMAPRLTVLRIPAQPADARMDFCGPIWDEPIPVAPALLPPNVVSASRWLGQE